MKWLIIPLSLEFDPVYCNRDQLANKMAAPTQLERQATHFKVVQFMHEAGVLLEMKSIPLATAATVYHKSVQSLDTIEHDPFLIATTALYLAGKIEEDHKKIRDVINVCYRVRHKDKPALDIGSTYWALRDSLTQCELLLMRVLQFRVSFQHPHKYLLYYMKSVCDWLSPELPQRVPFVRTAWSILRDTYHSDLCVSHKPQHLAVAVLYFSLQIHGLNIPGNDTARTKWWQVCSEDVSLENIRNIITKIIAMYETEKLVV